MIAGLLLAAAAIAGVANAPSAGAETCLPVLGCVGGTVAHHADNGYDPAIIVFCDYRDAFTNGKPDPDWTRDRRVPEGTSSRAVCGTDTDVIYLRSGEYLVCRHVTPQGSIYWTTELYAAGPHKITDLFSERCALKAKG